MKKLWFAIGAFLLLVPASALAADFRTAGSGQTVTIQKGESVKDLYTAANVVHVDGNVAGDLTAAGNTITVSGDVANNLMIAGNALTIDGAIAHTARVAGNTILVNNNIGADLAAAGSIITLSENGKVGGDIMVAGATIVIDGTVNGKAYLTGNEVTINGTVKGNVKIVNAERVSLGDNAVIDGNLTYSAKNEATIPAGAVIKGETNYTKSSAYTKNQDSDVSPFGMAALFGFMSLGTLAISIVTLLILVALLPKLSRDVTLACQEKPWSKMGSGFIFLVVVPVATIILLFTFIGIKIAAILGAIYLAGVGMAKIASALLAGVMIGKWWNKGKSEAKLWIAAIVGPIALVVLAFVPFVGWLIIFGLFLIVLGVIVENMMKYINNQKK